MKLFSHKNNDTRFNNVSVDIVSISGQLIVLLFTMGKQLLDFVTSEARFNNRLSKMLIKYQLNWFVLHVVKMAIFFF